MKYTVTATMAILLASGLSLNGCMLQRHEHQEEVSSRHYTASTQHRHDVEMERTSRRDGSHRREYEASAESRLNRYQSEWKDLGSQTKHAGHRAGRDLGNLRDETANDLKKAGRDLKSMRSSSSGQWQKYRADWEDLMDRIENSLQRQKERVTE